MLGCLLVLSGMLIMVYTACMMISLVVLSWILKAISLIMSLLRTSLRIIPVSPAHKSLLLPASPIIIGSASALLLIR